jgi:hypothetical protein
MNILGEQARDEGRMAQTRTREPLELTRDTHINMLDYLHRADERQERQHQAVFTVFHWQFLFV